MRLQLKAAAVRAARVVTIVLLAGLALAAAGDARAEQVPQNPSGEVAFRGNYWRDRNTRVLNPGATIRQSLPNGVVVNGSYLLDAITSASIAAGVTADQPFTELRHEAGLGIDVPLPRKVRISGNYSYSSESDYFSHSAGLRVKASLAQDNTALMFGVDYGHNTAGKRLGPTGYLVQGVLQTVHLVALATQVLSRRTLGTASYEVTIADGYQNNPYRPAYVGGERLEVEHLPEFRVRHIGALSLHTLFPTGSELVPYVALRPGLRGHIDSWGLKALNPELATYVPVGAFEFRAMVGLYAQWAVDFYRSELVGYQNLADGSPAYEGRGIDWGTRVNAAGQEVPNLVYTSDVKLGSYTTYTVDLLIKWRLTIFSGLGVVGDRLARSVLEASGGMWFADRAVGNQFGIPLRGGDPRAPAGCSLICGAGYASLGLVIPL